ncbi:MAG TPA: serine/threonine-protein phosphatase, partial [Telluria sp.]
KLYNCLGASALPKVEVSRQASLLPGDVLMLCSDGLWSMLPDDEIAHALTTSTIVRAVPDMLARATAIAGPKGDNTTALAIMWQGSPVGDATPTVMAESIISTQMMPEDSVNTTIAVAEEPEPSDAFDEDEIEKAIAEIRGAIEKSSQILKG